MEECDEMVGAVIEVRIGKSGDDSNLYTLCSNNGIRPCGTQFTGHDALMLNALHLSAFTQKLE